MTLNGKTGVLGLLSVDKNIKRQIVILQTVQVDDDVSHIHDNRGSIHEIQDQFLRLML